MLSERQQAELLRRYMARSARLAAAGAAATVEAIGGVTFNDAGIAAFRTAALPILQPIAAEASALSSGYMAALLERSVEAAAEFVEPDWRGPFIKYWSQLDAGVEAATEAAVSQAEAIGENSIVSTLRRTAGLVDDDRIIGWRRVLDANPCPWCTAISGRTYRSASSADFGHDRCQCGVTPVLR